MRFPRAGQTQAMDRQVGRRFTWELLYCDTEKAVCFPVFDSENDHETYGYLMIHAIRDDTMDDGGAITIATSRSPRFDVYARETFKLNQQRNPRAQADGAGDDDEYDDGHD